jgi:ribonuclease HI
LKHLKLIKNFKLKIYSNMNSQITNTLTINTDGGSRGNPGPAAWGFVVKENGEVVHTDTGFMGIATNNQAEYTAVLHAMIWLKKESNSVQQVTFILDSELVARQLSGIYKIKDEKLQKLASEIKKIERELTCAISYTIVRRELNKEADLLVNTSLDNAKS